MLTKQKALGEAIKVWTHLREYPFKTKFEACETVGVSTNYPFCCPLCAVYYKDDCNNCPLKASETVASCALVGQPYNLFIEGKTNTDRMSAADAIIKACERALCKPSF